MEVEDDDYDVYGNGKNDTDLIYQHFGETWQLRVDVKEICQHIYYLCIVGMLKCNRLLNHFNLIR